MPQIPQIPRLGRGRLVILIALGLILIWAVSLPAASLENQSYAVSMAQDGTLEVRAKDGAVQRFAPRFMVLVADAEPKLELRMASKPRFNVLSWGSAGEKAVAPKKGGHVEDGYDPAADRKVGKGRVMDYFKAAARHVSVAASSASLEGRAVVWRFPDQADFRLKASITLPEGEGEPLLAFEFVPKGEKWFSIGYAGAPAVAQDAIEGIWQPMVWQEKRFPAEAYLTESARCPVPTTLVTAQGVTTGVVADPTELPFMPLPTVKNSRFGVLVHNPQGQAQSMLFAPILGGLGSQLEPGKPFEFKLRLFVAKGDTVGAYEKLVRGLYQFHDYRRNDGMGSLNGTLERMIDYAMSKWAAFNEELRGSAYDTDVPGAVKNVSALHPLEIALVMDDAEIFEHRARPMIEYAISRQKFLFTVNPKVKGQGASNKMEGPGVPISDLTALYEMTHRRSGFLLRLAQELLPVSRVLNLGDSVPGNIWQNWLAMYRATGDAQWLEKAKNGADDYIKRRIDTPQADFDDKDSRGMVFWTSYAPNWIELFSLYETTGEARYLKAAEEGARRFAQYIWFCPVIPEGTVTVNEGGLSPVYRAGKKRIKIAPETVPAWRLSEIGLTSEGSETSKGHRAIFNAAFAPWMLRMGSVEGGDSFFHDIARSALIGRYQSFPGYHINTARTTVYEKPDFALRPMNELNSTTSIHYNHIWPHIAILLDYLVSDAEARSGGAIAFPGHFSEGYAYLQSRVYGDQPGKFHGEEAWLWMPKGLLTCDNPEVNYVAARGKDHVYLALTNQSREAINATVTLNPASVELLAGGDGAVRVWQDRNQAQNAVLKGGRVSVSIAPGGITSLAIAAKANVKFQNRIQEPTTPWKTDFQKSDFAGAHAMVLNFGQGLQSAYVYLQDRNMEKAALHYSTGGEWKTVEDTAFPFEFTVPLPDDAQEFAWRIETTGSDGTKSESETGKLVR